MRTLPSGGVSFEFGYIPRDGGRAKRVKCTRAIFERLGGAPDTAPDEVASMRVRGKYIIGLDADGLCVRVDFVNYLEPVHRGIRVDEDPPDNEFRLNFHKDTESYDVVGCPRGVDMREVETLLDQLDAVKVVRAGVKIGTRHVVREVSTNPDVIVITRPVTARRRRTAM
jgi:hypothetical protein